jgi:hypothetical protein
MSVGKTNPPAVGSVGQPPFGDRFVRRPNTQHLTPLVDRLFHSGYTPPVEWEVEYTDGFGAWWNRLTEDEQVDVD